METSGEGGMSSIQPCFQIAKVTRPLMSVSKICHHDYTAHFNKFEAVIKDAKGKVICRFARKGGLYVCKMRLEAPFTRQGS